MNASTGDWTVDDQLSERLNALVVAETALRAWTPTARHEHDLSMSNLVESLDNVTLESDIAKTRPKKGKKKYPMTGRHRKTGYQRFTSCFFQEMASCFARAYPDESPPRSTEIFSELAIQWRALTQEQRDQWNCYAKSRAPKPTLRLTFCGAVDEDLHLGEVVEYEPISPGARAWLDAERTLKVRATSADESTEVSQPVESKKVSWAPDVVETPPQDFEGAWFDAPRETRATNGPELDLSARAALAWRLQDHLQPPFQTFQHVELK